MCVKTTKYWFQSVISLAILHEKIQNLFFCWTFIHEYCTILLLRRIPTDNYHRSKKQIILADQHKNHHTSQQQHNTTQRQWRQQHRHESTWPWQKHKGCRKVPVLSRPSATCKTTTTATTTTTTTEANKSLKKQKRQHQKQKGQHWKQNSCSNFGSWCQQQRSDTHCWSQEFTQ